MDIPEINGYNQNICCSLSVLYGAEAIKNGRLKPDADGIRKVRSMKLLLKGLFLAFIAYLLGSISASILISRTRWGGDIRRYGSGNAGATNMARIYGMADGVLTLLADFLKALVATALGAWLLGDLGVLIGGMACLLGHCFPVFYHFKGGKGVSVGAAIGLAVHWKALAVLVVVFFAVALLTKKVSAGSVCAATALIVTGFVLAVSPPKLALCVLAPLLVIWQHRANIKRLLNGTEPDFKAAKLK